MTAPTDRVRVRDMIQKPRVVGMKPAGSLLADTHAHLGAAEFGEDCEAVVQRAQEAGVERILAVGSDLESSSRAVDLSRRFDIVYAAVGVHPHESNRFEAQAKDVHGLLGQDKVVAVGEIGLDYRGPESARKQQLEAFAIQAAWARDCGLPISVHNRDADQDVLAILRETGARAILHCFSGSSAFAASAVSMGCFISFAGNLTFPNAGGLRQVAGELPIETVLVETDSPVLAPQPWRGRRNEPSYVRATAETLAAAQGRTYEATAETLWKNAVGAFGWAVS